MKIAMQWAAAALGQSRLIAAALVAAAIIHILVTLSSAQIAEATAYRVLGKGLPINQVAFGKPITAKDQPLPFFSPDALYSFCRYDASTSRISVSAKLPDLGWSLSLHTPKGQNFYFVPGSSDRETDIKLVLEPPGNVFALGNTEITAAKQNIPVIKLPNVHGLIILKAPIKGLAYRRQIDEKRAAFKCQALSGLR
jgi:uncharacterized membrane protein